MAGDDAGVMRMKVVDEDSDGGEDKGNRYDGDDYGYDYDHGHAYEYDQYDDINL